VTSPSIEKMTAAKSQCPPNEISTSSVPSAAKSDSVKSQEEEYKLRLAEKRRFAREKAELAAEEAKKKEQDHYEQRSDIM